MDLNNIQEIKILLPHAYTTYYIVLVTTYGWEYGCVNMNGADLTSFVSYNIFYREDRVSNGAIMYLTISY